jgi:secreted Zn-dependent insulinase-like peptidase
MIEVSSEIKSLTGKRGVYGGVSIRLEYLYDPGDNELTFQAPEREKWAEAIKYAFAYFIERYRENGIKVIVTKVDSYATYTTFPFIIF